MNAKQRRKVFRRTGKHIQMNTVPCHAGHKARPTAIGYFCPKCQEWGNILGQANEWSIG